MRRYQVAKRKSAAVAETKAAPVAPAPVAAKAVVAGVGNPGLIPALGAAQAPMSVAARLASLGAAAPSKAKKGDSPKVKLDIRMEEEGPAAEVVLRTRLSLAEREKAAAEADLLALKSGGKVLRDAIEEWKLRAGQEKLAKDAKEKAARAISAACEPVRVEMSRKVGAVEPTVKLEGSVQYTQPHGYHKIALNDESKPHVEALSKAFGAGFGRYFREGYKVSVKAEALDEAMIADLQAVCAKRGVEFKEVFLAELSLIPTEELTADRVLKPEVEVVFNQARDEGHIVANAPTVKASS